MILAGVTAGAGAAPLPNAGHLTAIRHDTRPGFELSKFSRFQLSRMPL